MIGDLGVNQTNQSIQINLCAECVSLTFLFCVTKLKSKKPNHIYTKHDHEYCVVHEWNNNPTSWAVKVGVSSKHLGKEGVNKNAKIKWEISQYFVIVISRST